MESQSFNHLPLFSGSASSSITCFLIVCSRCLVGEKCHHRSFSTDRGVVFRSFSWNQHRPRHLESPFTDDQQKSHWFFRFPLSEKSVASSHHVPSHTTCTMICMVDVWSCALGVRGQSVRLGHETFLTCAPHSCHRLPSPRAPCPRRPSRSALSWSYGFSSLGLVFHAHSSCHQKVGLLQSNVTRFLCSLPSAT